MHSYMVTLTGTTGRVFYNLSILLLPFNIPSFDSLLLRVPDTTNRYTFRAQRVRDTSSMLRLGLAFSILAVAAAVNVGDELYAGDSNGRFYVLADKVSTRPHARSWYHSYHASY